MRGYPTLVALFATGWEPQTYDPCGSEVCVAHPFAQNAKGWGTHLIFCADDFKEWATRLVYYFIAETTGAPWAQGFFYMDKTGPIRFAVPGLCPSAFVGDVKPLKCGTKEPYAEPVDLEKFVQENKVH